LTQIFQSLMEHFIDLVKADLITLYLVITRAKKSYSVWHREVLRGHSHDYQELNRCIADRYLNQDNRFFRYSLMMVSNRQDIRTPVFAIMSVTHRCSASYPGKSVGNIAPC